MPHRSHEFTERCSQCDGEADAPCVRCGQIFCADHRPADDRRCGSCESEYRDKLASLGDEPFSLFSPLLIIATGAGAATGFIIGQVTAAVLVIAVGLIGTLFGMVGEHSDRNNPKLRAHREEVRQLRAGFLAERSRLLGSETADG